MNEFEKIFAETVWLKLKKVLKGRIFCKIIDGTLQVSIKCEDVVWRTNVEDIAQQVMMGNINCDTVVTDILSAYKTNTFEMFRKKYYYI